LKLVIKGSEGFKETKETGQMCIVDKKTLEARDITLWTRYCSSSNTA